MATRFATLGLAQVRKAPTPDLGVVTWLLHTSPRSRRLLPPLPRIVRQFHFPPQHAFRERFGGEGGG